MMFKLIKIFMITVLSGFALSVSAEVECPCEKAWNTLHIDGAFPLKTVIKMQAKNQPFEFNGCTHNPEEELNFDVMEFKVKNANVSLQYVGSFFEQDGKQFAICYGLCSGDWKSSEYCGEFPSWTEYKEEVPKGGEQACHQYLSSLFEGCEFKD